ncbi:MAG: choice-of-anchor L domain-containing protein [Sideroxyarcus sp.]|nr:choice-of-anchor L domain-containing protein [Sideroxyarcus sp.]
MIRMTKVGLIIASLLVASQASALNITGVTSNAGETLTNTWLGSSSGINVTTGSISYIGNTDISQSGTYTGFNLSSSSVGQPAISLADGILLTSGSALIPLTNTSSNYTNITNTVGNSWVSAASGGNESYDSNTLSFNFTVDTGITSVSSMFIYGSDEYPEFAGTTFADGFAFVVDGTNYATFSDGSYASLSSVASNGNFNNNTAGGYGIEYDGFTSALQLVGLLDLSKTTHTLQIAVADTGDHAYDTGVFLASLSACTTCGGGGIISSVPEPETYAMLLVGLSMLGFTARRRKELND